MRSRKRFRHSRTFLVSAGPTAWTWTSPTSRRKPRLSMTRRRNAGYSEIVCPQCGRRLPLDEQGRLPTACPVCDEPVVVPETAEEIAERQAGYAKAIGPQIPKEQLPEPEAASACVRSPCNDPKIEAERLE